MFTLTLLCRTTDVPYVVTKSLSGAEPMYRTSLQKVSRVSNQRTVRRYEKVFFLNFCVKISLGHVRQKLSIPCLEGGCDSVRLDFGQILEIFIFFPMVMHRIFKKHRHYFPISLGIRESFREIAARRKRVKGTENLKQCQFTIT